MALGEMLARETPAAIGGAVETESFSPARRTHRVRAEPVGGFSRGLHLCGEVVVEYLHFDSIRQARFAAGGEFVDRCRGGHTKTPELPAGFWWHHSTTISKLRNSFDVRITLTGAPEQWSTPSFQLHVSSALLTLVKSAAVRSRKPGRVLSIKARTGSSACRQVSAMRQQGRMWRLIGFEGWLLFRGGSMISRVICQGTVAKSGAGSAISRGGSSVQVRRAAHKQSNPMCACQTRVLWYARPHRPLCATLSEPNQHSIH